MSNRQHTRLTVPMCALLVLGLSSLIVVGTSGTTESESYSGPAAQVNSAFFGMHVHRAADGTRWPSVPIAGWRLWDAQVSWPLIEPQRGNWNFDLLDRYVQLAVAHQAGILLTLGLTPTWASARSGEKSAYGSGNASPPRQLTDWELYVRTIAARYKGVISTYEVWNEPNMKGTFTGSPSEMIDLTRSAYATLKAVDPNIVVVSPSPTTWDGVAWLDSFLKQGGCRDVDVIGYHFYVTPDAPEKMIALIQRVKASLRKYHCDKPIWNTESGWTAPKHFSSEAEAAGYMMRTYILNWLLGVQRCYWYAWDNRNWSTLDLSSPADGGTLPAGAAYGVIQSWLVGSVMQSCERGRSGVWICVLLRGPTTTRLIWSDKGTQTLTLPASWHAATATRWTGQQFPATSQLTVDDAPVLLKSTDGPASSSLPQPEDPAPHVRRQ